MPAAVVTKLAQGIPNSAIFGVLKVHLGVKLKCNFKSRSFFSKFDAGNSSRHRLAAGASEHSSNRAFTAANKVVHDRW